MLSANQVIIGKFFDAYQKHDTDVLRQVMDEDEQWYFLGNHPFAGVKRGMTEVIAFFDAMGNIMSRSRPSIEKLIVAENEQYVIECQHILTHQKAGPNIDHYVSVLWTIRAGKIVEGRHFFADPEAVNAYFTAAKNG